MKNELLIVDVGSSLFGWVQCFCKEETAEAELERVKAKNLEDIAKYKGWLNDKDSKRDAEFVRGLLKRSEKAKYEIMTWKQFENHRNNVVDGLKVKETNEEEFERALNVLPPIYWYTIDGVEMFCMSEYYSGSITAQYAKKADKYYTCLVDVLRKET